MIQYGRYTKTRGKVNKSLYLKPASIVLDSDAPESGISLRSTCYIRQTRQLQNLGETENLPKPRIK
ncbi:MAG: hypothetical protein BBJ57_03695 [Desulfobacterales bacterium PC51MH44]|nr:MAG: hypothetical protein BBJ57_03695 [Desulfobacterales bacterium PC51MH44]